MEKISWIKELVKAEQQMEETGLIDMTFGFDKDRVLIQETLEFLLNIKTEFVDAISAFNELRSSPVGRIKVYGIAKTHADFMLFRNGYKLIFSFSAPGQILVRFNFMGTTAAPMTDKVDAKDGHSTSVMAENLIEAKWGPYGELIWTHKYQPFKTDYMIRHYLSLFIKESSK